MAMVPEVKKKFVAALRDGSYKQTKHQLRDLDDHFDVIGVLMDLASLEGVISAPKRHDKTSGAVAFFGYSYDGNANRITKPVSEWSGMGYWSANHLLFMNDKGKSFNEIADYVEANF